jgi:hypothetical protein
VSGWERVESHHPTDIGSISGLGFVVNCPSGKKVLGGGGEVETINFYCTGAEPRWNLEESYPRSDSQWYVLLAAMSSYNCTGEMDFVGTRSAPM